MVQTRADILDNTALNAALNAQFLFQIGIFTALPMILCFILEQGFLRVSLFSSPLPSPYDSSGSVYIIHIFFIYIYIYAICKSCLYLLHILLVGCFSFHDEIREWKAEFIPGLPLRHPLIINLPRVGKCSSKWFFIYNWIKMRKYSVVGQ